MPGRPAPCSLRPSGRGAVLSARSTFVVCAWLVSVAAQLRDVKESCRVEALETHVDLANAVGNVMALLLKGAVVGVLSVARHGDVFFW